MVDNTVAFFVDRLRLFRTSRIYCPSKWESIHGSPQWQHAGQASVLAIASWFCLGVSLPGLCANEQSQYAVGSLIVLKNDAELQKSKWIVDDIAIEDRRIETHVACDELIAVAHAPGRYRFIIAGLNVNGDIELKYKWIEVTASPRQTRPPESPPSSDPSAAKVNLGNKIKAMAMDLQDQSTLSLMALKWKEISGKVRGSTSLENAGRLVSEMIDSVMESRDTKIVRRYPVDWDGKWRGPVNQLFQDAIQDGTIKAPADYTDVLEIAFR